MLDTKTTHRITYYRLRHDDEDDDAQARIGARRSARRYLGSLRTAVYLAFLGERQKGVRINPVDTPPTFEALGFLTSRIVA